MAVYLIEPSPERRTVRGLAEAFTGELPAAGALVEMVIDRVEVCTASHSCRVYLAGVGTISDEDRKRFEEWLTERVKNACRDLGKLAAKFEVVCSQGGSCAVSASLVSDEEGFSQKEESEAVDEIEDDDLIPDEESYMRLIMSKANQLRAGDAAEASAGTSGGKSKEDSPTILGRKINGTPTPVHEIQDEERSVVVEGSVIKVDVHETKAGRLIISFYLTDYTDSIEVKIFTEEAKLAEAIACGMWLRVRGSVQYDRYSQELVMFASDIMKAERPVRRDEAPEKRIELHLHTKMSAMDATVDTAEAVATAAAWGHPAIAITDHGVLQAYPDAYAASKKYGIKVLYGLEGYLIDGDDPKARSYHIIILARTQEGLKNLYKLVSYSHMHCFYRRPKLPRQKIMELRDGLIIGSACEAGELYQAIVSGKSQAEIEQIASFYDYLEIQPLGNNHFMIGTVVQSEDELKEINRRIYELGKRLGKPVVATGDVHFLEQNDEIYRRILLAGQGYEDAENQAPLYLRTTEEMLAEFSYLGEEAAYEVVVTAPHLVAEQIDNLQPVPDGLHTPVMEGAEEQITNMTYARAKEIYGDPLPEIVQKRLEKELKSIVGNGYSVLYLIARKLVKKSLSDGYLVGSRGSVGSSLVATMCEITEVNPLPPHYVCPECKYSEFITDGSVASGPDLPDKACPRCGSAMDKHGFDIPFEVFLGFKGDKVPDIDLNFSGEYQSNVHKYCEELFGSDHVFRAGTIGTLAEKTAYGFVRKYFEGKGENLRSAEVERLVQGCTGVRRTTGQHPGGMMVVPKGYDVYQFTPIQYPANDPASGTVTTHFDYHAIHDQLVKLDILGHDDPTTLRMLQDLTGVDVRKIPLDDLDTMAIFSRTDTLGVKPEDIGTSVGTLGIPEFGTAFVRRMLEEIRPTTFGELVRISGFSHGTNVWANNAQDLIKNHIADAKEAIATRDDIMNALIQMGMEPSVAFKIMERVRKGKGLSSEDEEAMKAVGTPQWFIDSCHKISYLFPKAHAVAYVTMAFRIAYFKVHYPLAYYATYFSVRADFDVGLTLLSISELKRLIAQIEGKGNEASAKEKGLVTVCELLIEAKVRGVKFLPVNLYESHPSRFLIKDDALLCPLGGLQGVGASAALAIAEGRKLGEFTSIEDMRSRTGVSKTVIEALREAGALDGIPETGQMSLF